MTKQMIVVVAEKPSVARDIAFHLGARSKGEGYLEGNGYQVTWAFGHLVGLKEPEEYFPEWKRWSLKTLPMVPDQFQLKAVGDPKAKKQLTVIKRLLKKADTIICATDAGREGELIFRYIMEYCGLGNKPFRRLWLSSLTPQAITAALAALQPGSNYDGLYHAARCRSEADWVVGLNGTRHLTLRYGAGCLLSLGRVQTPVLAMIVERDDEIRHFLPEPFWVLMTRYRDTLFTYIGDRFLQKELAEKALHSLSGHPLKITGLEKKKVSLLPPQLFDLTELQREMNRRYGMSAADTLKEAQTLYESKLITYPRTDSRYLKAEMKKEVGQIIQNLLPRKPKETAALAKLNFTKRLVDDAKVGDHHAILPTGQRPGVLPLQQERLYDAIHMRLIAAFYPPCIKEETRVEAHVFEASFVAKGVVLCEPGWTVLQPQKEEKEEKTLPSFTKGESGPHTLSLKEGKTEAPKSYSESALLGAMAAAGRHVEDEEQKEALKEKGLGTAATRAAIIETLITRGYIYREKKNLKATDQGRYLIALIQEPALKSPSLTGEWESKLKGVEAGKISPEAFMKEIKQFTQNVLALKDVVSVEGNALGFCPRCKQPIIEGRRGYGCSAWKSGCSYVLWKEQEGMVLEPAQAGRLLQSNFLFHPDRKSVLTLTKKGHLVQIPIPEAKPFRKKRPVFKKGAKKNT